MQTLKHIIGYSLPVIVLVLFFWLYAGWHFTGVDILKTTGLSGLTLFGIIFIIGPLPRFWPDLSPWKVFRPYWAKWAVLIIFVHLCFAFALEYNLDLITMFSRANEELFGMSLGLTAFLYFVFMVVISEKTIRARLGVHWKQLHVLGYAAFTLAIRHFIDMEGGFANFHIKRVPGRIAFAFAVVVLMTRLYVLIWARMTKLELPPKTPEGSSINPVSNDVIPDSGSESDSHHLS